MLALFSRRIVIYLIVLVTQDFKLPQNSFEGNMNIEAEVTASEKKLIISIRTLIRVALTSKLSFRIKFLSIKVVVSRRGAFIRCF